MNFSNLVSPFETADGLNLFFVFRMEVNLKIVENFPAHTDRCWSVDWSPNGQLLSSSGGDKCAKIWGKDKQVITSLNESRTIR